MSVLRYPRPPELARLGPRHNVVEASAGTGKTFLLEHLLVDCIVSRGVPIEEILVVTFTEKATAELVLRLRRLLGELVALEPDHPKARQAAAASPGETWIIDAGARDRLAKSLLSFDRASISTIHGFCQRVLREHAFAQGRLFDEGLVAEKVVVRRAFRELLRAQASSSGPEAQALRAWLASDRTVADLEDLLCECASHRVAEVRPRFDPDQLREAMRAWPSLSEDEGALALRLRQAKVHASTVKKCARELAWLAREVTGHQGDALGLLGARSDLLQTLDYLQEKLPGATTDVELADLTSAVAALRAAAVPLEAAVASAWLPLLRERAAADKRRAGAFDYADMLDLVGRALCDASPARDVLLLALRRRYRVALIDEFQDTDEVQWSIFRRIFVDGAEHHALAVIGDPKQAIYGFRGADVHTYLEAREALRAAGAGHLHLGRNFRSTAALVRVQNLAFGDQARFFRPESGIRYQTELTCGGPDRVLDATPPESNAPVVVLALDGAKPRARDLQVALQASVAGEISRLTDPTCGPRLRGRPDGRESVRPGDIFVLTFTNGESRAIGRALGRAGIPFAFYKQGSLYESPEAEEILAVLRALASSEDRSLCARAFLTRFFALDLAQAAACLDSQIPSEPSLRLRGWAALARKGDIPGLFASLVDQSGILRREVFANAGERGLTNITHVLEILQAQWAKSHASLPELVERLAAYVRGSDAPPGRDSDLQRLETDQQAVQILTVHMAKGLEADVVFLYGGTGEPSRGSCQAFYQDGARVLRVGKLDPAAEQAARNDKNDERSRLLYVAITRARYRLYLPHYPAGLKNFTGPYWQANHRLEQILGPDLAKPDPLFAIRKVDRPAREPLATPLPATAAATPVPPELLIEPAEPADLACIREQRSGFLVTSYSAVKRAHGSPKRQSDGDLDAEPGRPQRSQGADELPVGAQAGIFLHEVLAEVSLAELAARPALADWLATPGVRALLEKQARRHGRAPSEIDPAARLVHRAYTRDMRLEEVVIPGLASATPARREMEFHFPIPAATHRLWSRTPEQVGSPPWKIERGVVKGFVDILFEHRDRVYVGDWKSDTLPDYAAETLDAHVQQSYQIQARIYTVAVLRLCGVSTAAKYDRRFGGTFFCFLRGLDADDSGAGIHCVRPSWNDILAWERDMLAPGFWGIAP
jgi:exodeoxyribonuclease V beta subunit